MTTLQRKQSMPNLSLGYRPSIGSEKGSTELVKRLLFLLGAVIFCRFGGRVLVPGIDSIAFSTWMKAQEGHLTTLLNFFSAGSSKNASVLSLGIAPYIQASWLMQVLVKMIPSLTKAAKEEGEEGRRKISRFTRIGTLGFAVIQAVGVLAYIASQPQLLVWDSYYVYWVAGLSLIAGSLILTWVADQITENGLGNGTSILILLGILSSLPRSIAELYDAVFITETLSLWTVAGLLSALGALLYGITYIESGQRRVAVSYATQRAGPRFIPILPTTYLPMKFNMAGVMPVIYGIGGLNLLSTGARFLCQYFPDSSALEVFKDMLQFGHPLHVVLAIIFIVGTQVLLSEYLSDPSEIADYLKRDGALLPGVRPGEQTAKWLGRVTRHLSLLAGIYVSLVYLLPEQLCLVFKTTQTWLPGTSLMIVVGAVIDSITQIHTLLLTKQYAALRKKVNVRSFSV